jgi:hypothetical protein
MKTYALPEAVPVPHFDYMNYDNTKVAAQEAQHTADLKAYLIAQGFKGKHTGRIYREQVADGYALYMMADGRGSCLIHLPYCDGYSSRTVHAMTKKGVLEIMDADDKWQAALAKMAKK